MHIGIIMDGNGRWATAQGLPRLAGHKAGLEGVLELVRKAPALGVTTITLFAFAIANWKRDKDEVDGLWKLFHLFFAQHLQELIQEGVRVTVIGNRAGLPKIVLDDVEKIEFDSQKNSTLLLQVALNYDGIDEVTRMVQKIVKKKPQIEEITDAYVLGYLDTTAGCDPDIIIRTGMTHVKEGMSVWRGSAFLPLQSVQSVCVSSEILWPDFSVDDLQKIIEFADPDSRLFGGQRNS